jgi:hypothetical protein
MTFTDTVPTIPGWYWERDGHGCERIIKLPHCGVWPTYWRTRRENVIQSVLEDKEFDIAKKLREQDDKEWLVEWAGPLIPPN